MKKTTQQQQNDIFDEFKRVTKVIGATTMEDFRNSIEAGKAGLIIAISEALQEKKIVHLTDDIRKHDAKVVLIAGPSSSGKTTFSKRLSVQLMACGYIPHPISLDDYYVDRVKTPLDDKGEYDYESLYAIDLDLLGEQLQALFDGKEVELPRYDFKTGKSIKATGNRLRIGDNDILVIEGIHALNPELLARMRTHENIYKVFVSPMTGLMIGEENGRHIYTPPVDNRLLRRMIRDVKQRGCSAQDTIKRWASVRAGEEKWIYPFIDEADRLFNTALYYELAVIKAQAEPQLQSVPADAPEYAEAQRLLGFLKDIPTMPEDFIPPISLLREFLGGSAFE